MTAPKVKNSETLAALTLCCPTIIVAGTPTNGNVFATKYLRRGLIREP
jgi:hypothetical protein